MQNIHIIENKILYEILDEIKSKLKFNIFFYENEDKFMNSENFKANNSIIVANDFLKNIIDNKNIFKKTIYILDDLPIKLTKLIEQINIHLIRQIYENKSQISIKDYIININSRLINSDNKSLKLTEKEINIILFLFEKKKPQKINVLQKEIWGYSSSLDTHTVETHIYRLRKKIKSIFSDEDFILSGENGYSIT